MDDVEKSIIKSLGSGQYFIDSRKWYFNNFVAPIIEKNILVIFLSILVFCTFITQFYIFSKSTLDGNVVYTTTTDDITDQYAFISPLGTVNQAPDVAMEEFLIKLYITKRESYSYKNLQEQIFFIFNNSSAAIAKNFQASISINEPTSPVIIYQKFGSKAIDILSAKKIKNAKKWIVQYQVNSINSEGKSEPPTIWEADIEYVISSMEKLLEDNAKVIDFIVTNYVTKKLR